MLQFQNRKVQLPNGAPVVVSRVLGSIDGGTVRQFEEKLLGFQEQGVQHLIIVFSQVSYINSTGMGVLVKLADKFQEVGGDISLIDVPDKMIALFKMLGIDSIIKISKSEEEALTNFQLRLSQIANLSPSSSTPETSTNKKNVSRPPAPMISKNTAPRRAPSPPSPSSPATTQKPAAKTSGQQRPRPKPVVIVCKKCTTKISLGTRPRVGTYKCPRCMALFKLFRTGKIQFV